jgi:hypothetical protein
MATRVQQVFANLNEEIESLEAHARRIEGLLPHLPPNARQQWEAARVPPSSWANLSSFSVVPWSALHTRV